jgi:hypothetical protein
MSFIEGGNFKCTATDFETGDRSEWNEHAKECGKHTERGSTICMGCGEPIEFSGLPFVPYNPIDGSKTIQLRCDDCETTMKGSVKVTKRK